MIALPFSVSAIPLIRRGLLRAESEFSMLAQVSEEGTSVAPILSGFHMDLRLQTK